MNLVQSNQESLSQCCLWTALVTPFNDDGSIDYTSLRRIAEEQQQAGNGILLLGSTGEGLALDGGEQLAIVEFVCALELQVPIMVGVSGFNLAQQSAWIKQCNQLAVDAFMLASPLYAKPGPKGQAQWFEALLNAAEKPCMLYNVPSRSGIEIAPQVLSQLAGHKNLWSLKEASGDINKFIAYRQANPDVAIYSGEDALMPYLAQAGAVGLVSVAANAWPEATNLYVKKSLDGLENNLHQVWKSAVDALFSVANPIPVKVLMQHQHMINSAYLRPPLTTDELDSSDALLAADQQITEWLCQERCQGITTLADVSGL